MSNIERTDMDDSELAEAVRFLPMLEDITMTQYPSLRNQLDSKSMNPLLKVRSVLMDLSVWATLVI